jgi:dTMP kinase
MTNTKGKLIVIDGTDGSGKATQTRLLVYRLKQLGYKVETIDFPQYNTKSAGLIENYLEGKYGEADEVNPMIASCFYACDRYDSSFKIKNWLKEGKIVIVDRYVTSNMAHQGCKINNLSARKDFYSWLYRLEHNLFQIPEPDLTLILHVEAEIAQNLLKKRQRSDWKDKKQDIHEDKIEHLRKAEQIYLEIARSFSNINLIRCTRDRKILNPDKINTLVWEKVKEEVEDMPHLYHSTPENNHSPLFKIKRLSNKAHYTEIENQAHYGVNLHSSSYHSINPKETIIIDTEIEVNIPEGIFATILKNPNKNIHVLNEKLEPNTRKKIKVGIINLGNDIHHISPGDILAEMIIQRSEVIEFVEEEQEDKKNFRIFNF